MSNLNLQLSAEVEEAFRTGRPVVALESTIISHGMPFPQNFKCASEVENIIRANGATPATIGILNGQILVGMSETQLETFAQTPCVKVSRRDLSTVVGLKKDGATTVATTMLIAHLAGIQIFVTGGIGGVHRGAGETWDVSADLTELGRTPVTVVCAGAKSILDLPKTLEYMETQGVVVIGLRSKTFPAFFTPSSGLPVPTACDTEADVAAIVDAHNQLGLTSGIVVGNPIPAELATEVEPIEKATSQAVKEAADNGIVSAEVTPFLLKRINELTGGESLRANVELVKHNALIGARIATSLKGPRRAIPMPVESSAPKGSVKLAIVGGSVLDFTAKPSDKKKFGEFGTAATSVPGTMRTSVGGVGRTIAELVARLSPGAQGNWTFESVLGDDAIGDQVAAACNSLQLPATLHRLQGQRTATYTAMLDGTGELVTAVADMAVFDAWPAVSARALGASRLLLMDTNVPAAVLREAARASQEFWVEPVSIAKASRISGCLEHVSLASPNLDELRAMVEAIGATWSDVKSTSLQDLEKTLPAAVEPLFARGIKHLLVTCGRLGAVLCSISKQAVGNTSGERFSFPGLQHQDFTVERRQWQTGSFGRGFLSYSVPPLATVESVTGAGDSLIAATAWAHGLQEVPLPDAVLYGLAAARLCLASAENVSPQLSAEKLVPQRQSSRL